MIRQIGVNWDACAPLRHLSLVQANPPGAGPVTHRRSYDEKSRNPKFYNNFSTSKYTKDSFASSVNTRYPLMLQLPGPHYTAR